MSIIFRVQDKDGRGPWKPGFSHRWVETRPDHDHLQPFFLEFGPVDKKALFGAHLGCGCQTIEQLQRWFTRSEYETLRGFGYRAVRMEVGRILAKSDIQCVFERATPLASDVIEIELYAEMPHRVAA